MELNGLDLGVLQNLLIALGIGALVGVERERKNLDGPTHFGGLRTFTLLAQAGAISGWLSHELLSPWPLVGGLLAVVALIASVSMAGANNGVNQGLTTEVAGLTEFLLGALVMLGHAEVAVMLAVVTAGLLALKEELHELVRGLSAEDVFAGLKLLTASFIVLPLLPDYTVDPWGALNPYKLWLLVILISGLSLVGYVAVRWLGERRGQALTGLFGGLVSSTAVTLSFARRSKLKVDSTDAMAMGVLLAWGVMFARVLVEVAVVNRALLPQILPSMAALAGVCLLSVALFWRRSLKASQGDDDPGVDFTNPFSLTEAIKFGLFFAAILLAVKLARSYTSESWLYGVAALAGTTDVDAITLSMARAAGEGLSSAVAVNSILVACISNSVVKCGMVIALGSRGLSLRVGVVTLALTAVAGAVVFAGVGGWTP